MPSAMLVRPSSTVTHRPDEQQRASVSRQDAEIEEGVEDVHGAAAGRATAGPPQAHLALGMSATWTVVVAASAGVAEPGLVQLGDEAFLLQRGQDLSLTWPASGASLANMIEYFSPLGMRSTTLNCGLSLL